AARAGKVAARPTVYGVAGERPLAELKRPWLPGYEGSAPVRIGNRAAAQTQLDVYGEVIDALTVARSAGLDPDADAWRFERVLIAFLEKSWQEPDHGIWEVRGEKRQFTHYKVMAWVAVDRAIRSAVTYRIVALINR